MAVVDLMIDDVVIGSGGVILMCRRGTCDLGDWIFLQALSQVL